MSTLKNSDRSADILLDFIATKESNGNYNAIIGNPDATDDLSQKTIHEIYLVQSWLKRLRKPSTAVGRYQIIKPTLETIVQRNNIPLSAKFTPEKQDEMAMYLLRLRGFDKFKRGLINAEEFLHRLSMEWASLPDPQNTGKSHYDGVGENRAGHTLTQAYRMLDRLERHPSPDRA